MFPESRDRHLGQFESPVVSPPEKPVPISRRALFPGRRPLLLCSLWLRACPCWTLPVNEVLHCAGVCDRLLLTPRHGLRILPCRSLCQRLIP